jgi:hypothetical protein
MDADTKKLIGFVLILPLIFAAAVIVFCLLTPAR